MRDPTREEMTEFLAAQTCGEDMDDDIEVAIYWFAMYWHGGQSSNLYSVLSTSPYSPGPIGRLEGESDIVMFMFEALEGEFGHDKQHDHPPRVQRGPDDPHDGHTQSVAVDPIRHGALT